MPRKRLTENQILRLNKKLAKVHKLKSEISALADESRKAETLKEKMAEILTLLRSIASSMNPPNVEFNSFLNKANLRFIGMDITSFPWPAIEHEVHLFCNYLNSAVFDFSVKGGRIFTSETEQAAKGESGKMAASNR